jgi:plastocyanin
VIQPRVIRLSMGTRAVTVVAAVSGLALLPVPNASAAAPATVSDAIVGFTFVLGSASLNAPDQMLRINTGDTVVWTNLDPVSHSVAFDAMPESRYLKKAGDTAKVTFTEAGYFTYHCNEHPEFPGMKGLVFVTDPSGRGF